MEKSSESGSTLFDNWLNFQKDFFNNWVGAANDFQKSFTGFDKAKETKSEIPDFFGFYQSWKDTFGKYFETMLKNYPINVSTDTMSKLFRSADMYVKIYEFWEPLTKALQEQMLDPESYKDMCDPSKYKDMLNDLFGFSSPETVKEFYGQASKLIETWGSKAQHFTKPWSDAIQKNIDASFDFAKGDFEAGYNMFHNVYSAFDSTFGKVFKMPAVGKDREEVELLLKTFDKYSVFLARNTEFQHKIFTTGQNAMEKVIEVIAERVKNKEDVTNFDEFFRLWAETNEKDFLELFKTEEFAKLQGVVLDVALEARRYFQQLMELYLQDFPVALRSEMNDVYKTVYNLKKSVRELSKENRQVVALRKEVSSLKEKIKTIEKKIAK